MNRDVAHLFKKFLEFHQTYESSAKNVNYKSLELWNESVDQFCSSVHAIMISGSRYRSCFFSNMDGDDDRVMVGDDELVDLQQQTVACMGSLLEYDVVDELLVDDEISVNDDDSQSMLMLDQIICSLRNVYRLLHLLGEKYSDEKAKDISRPLKTEKIFKLLLRVMKKFSYTKVVTAHASMAIFQGIRGDATCINLFVQNLGGIPFLLHILLSEATVLLKLSIVRHIHMLLGFQVNQKMVAMLNRINECIRVELESEPENMYNITSNSTIDLVHVFVGMASWCIRSSAFPGESGDDKRADLIEEIFQVLYLVQPTYTGNLAKHVKLSPSQEEKEEVMTQLGILLCEILNLSHQDSRAYRVKLATVTLLMDMPSDYSQYLVLNGGIKQLLDILDYQLSEAVIEKRQKASLSLTPILVVMNKLTSSNSTAKDIVKERIFPTNDSDSENDVHKTGKAQNSPAEKQKNDSSSDRMKPKDAPYGTLRWKLIELMTNIDSYVKRCASELLWNICDENAKEYVNRTGYGNAIHMLSIKGLVQLPSSK